jgi:peptide deformylase
MSKLEDFYPIQTWIENKILRTKSEKIDKITNDVIDFAEDLMELMYEYDGVWLAAPQIWKNIRMIAVTFWKESKKWPEWIDEEIMINPNIVDKSYEIVESEEACLSVPNVIWKVKRHQNIVVEYLNTKWKKKTKKIKNYNAFIVQHEIDHLNWVLFVDKLL